MANSRQYEWADVTVIVGGKDMITIRAVKYKKTVDREAQFSKGRKAHSIQTGNITVDGEIAVLQSEIIEMEESSNQGILDMSVDIEVSYSANGILRTDRIEGARFTEYEKSLTQGDKMMEITIPFLALDVEEGV